MNSSVINSREVKSRRMRWVQDKSGPGYEPQAATCGHGSDRAGFQKGEVPLWLAESVVACSRTLLYGIR